MLECYWETSLKTRLKTRTNALRNIERSRRRVRSYERSALGAVVVGCLAGLHAVWDETATATSETTHQNIYIYFFHTTSFIILTETESKSLLVLGQYVWTVIHYCPVM